MKKYWISTIIFFFLIGSAPGVLVFAEDVPATPAQPEEVASDTTPESLPTEPQSTETGQTQPEASEGETADEPTSSVPPETDPLESSPQPTDDTPVIPVEIESGEPVPDATGSDLQPSVDGTDVQETYNTQEDPTVDPTDVDDGATVVEETPENVLPPEEEQTPDPSEVTAAPTTTDDSLPEEITDTIPDTEIPPEEDLLPEEIVPEPEVIDDEVPFVKPKPVYAFSVNGKTFTTHKKVPNPAKIAGEKDAKPALKKGAKLATLTDTSSENVPDTIETDVTEEVFPDIDNDAGVMHISASCAKTYYVILLYKNKEDYAENPGSYIYNKAFACDGGSFDYSVDSLPTNLEDGSYYLLIGEQGDTGTWDPASELTEIMLERNIE